MTSKSVKNLRVKRQVKGIIDDIINGGKSIIRPIIKPFLGKGRQVKSTGPTMASYARNPMKSKFSLKSTSAVSQSMTGTDFLATVTIPQLGASVGTILTNVVANPYSLGISRLKQIAPLYQRYFFKKLTVEYVPICGSTTVGQIIGYFDYDVSNDPTGTSGEDNLKRAAAHYGEQPVQVWQGADHKVTWSLKRVDNLTDLYCKADGIDNHWTDQGRFVLMTATDWPVMFQPLTIGSLYIHYDVEFFVPQLGEDVTLGHTIKYGKNEISTFDTIFDGGGWGTWGDLPVQASGRRITLPPGHYIMYADASMNTATTAVLTNCSWSSVLGSAVNLEAYPNQYRTSGNSFGVSAFLEVQDLVENVVVDLYLTPSGSPTLDKLRVYLSACPDRPTVALAKTYNKFKHTADVKDRESKLAMLLKNKSTDDNKSSTVKSDIPMSSSSSITQTCTSSSSVSTSTGVKDLVKAEEKGGSWVFLKS